MRKCLENIVKERNDEKIKEEMKGGEDDRKRWEKKMFNRIGIEGKEGGDE